MANGANDPVTSLQARIEEFQQQFLRKAPPEIVEAMRKGTEDLVRSKIAQRSVQVSMKAPDFELPNQNGEAVRLYAALERGPAVVTFYRGGW